VDIGDLVQMLENPAKGLLRQRLDLALPEEFRAAPARLTEALSPLQRWQVGERLLQQRIRGWGAASAHAEKARGSLPVAPLADELLADLQPRIDGVTANALEAGYDRARWRQVGATVGSRRVVGPAQVVLDADGRAGTVVLVTTSKPKATHLMRVWVRQLALTVAERDRVWSGRVVDTSAGVSIPPVNPVLAEQVLAQLLTVRDLGLRCALPLPAEAASAYARSELVHPTGDPELEASRAFAVDVRDDALRRVWGEQVTFDQILAAPRPDGVRPPSDSWFAVLARTVWRPVHEARVEAVPP
jgi:exodeoxyribonuclease V gamma subunit